MNKYKRQLDIYNPEAHENVHVTVIGLGNIGSHTTLALARMGIQHFTLVDFDTVEEHNLSSQAYKVGDVGRMKCDALMEAAHEVNEDAHVDTFPTKYTDDIRLHDITIIAVDSMETRRALASLLLKYPHTQVIDGRMGGGQIEVHTATGKTYSETLTSDADDDPCSARYISYTSYIIAGMIANTAKRILCGEDFPRSVWMHTNTWEVLKKA